MLLTNFVCQVPQNTTNHFIVLLKMKSMHIDRVVNFPFPTPPPQEALESAEKLLVALGAIHAPPPARTLKEAQKCKILKRFSMLKYLHCKL